MSTSKPGEYKQPEDVSYKLYKSSNLTDESSDKKEYILYPYRWIICIFFSIQQIGLGMMMVGFSPITAFMAKVYDVNSIWTTMIVLCYSIIFVPVNVPANALIKAKGIAYPIRIASVVFIAGAWIRMLVKVDFFFILIGQCINALGMPFVQALGATIASTWFGEKERALITTITSLASVLGLIIGFALPAIFVDDEETNFEKAKDQIYQFIWVQSIAVTVCSIPCFFTVRKEPNTPPSRSAEQMRDPNKNAQEENKFWKDMGKMLSSLNFWLLNIVFSFIYSIYNTLGAAVSVITEKFGYSSTDNSIFGVVFIVSGISGSILHGILLDKYGKYKLQYILI